MYNLVFFGVFFWQMAFTPSVVMLPETTESATAYLSYGNTCILYVRVHVHTKGAVHTYVCTMYVCMQKC